MSSEDRKRRVSTSSGNPRPMKKKHLAAEDIFGGDENKHRAADEEVCQTSMWRFFVEHPDTLTKRDLGNFVRDVVSGIPGIHENVIARELENADIRDFVKKCIRNKDNKSIRNLAFLRKGAVAEDSQSQYDNSDACTREQIKATMKAWGQPYIGEAHKCLYEVMHKYQENETAYGRFLSIVQSSGTGKSRMVDELSKEHLVVPINLRGMGENGFPAADRHVRDFLNNGSSPLEVNARYGAFFTVLFQQLLARFKNIDQDLARLNIEKTTKNFGSTAAKFHFLMTHGQAYGAPNQYRKTFYELVCAKAEDLFRSEWPPRDMKDQQKDEPMIHTSTSNSASVGNDPPKTSTIEEIERVGKQPTSPPIGFHGGTNIRDAAEELVVFLNPMLKNVQKLDIHPPVIILAFDEAHQLTKVQGSAEKPWSRFSELRRNIRKLKLLPIFSLFISTVSNISDFTPVPKEDMSIRIMNELPSLLPPFTELGFDQMLETSPVKENTVDIQQAATDEFMCKFGRPLFGTRFKYGKGGVQEEIVDFAASKLICGENYAQLNDDQKLACMAVRLALEFNSTTLKSRQREHLQVAKHMRVFIKVDDGFETVVSVAPSEPIMAEGARSLMCNPACPFNLPESLLHELQTPGLDKGSRAELICLVLLLLACDKAGTRVFSVHEFFKNLLNDGDYAQLLEAKPSRRRNMESIGEASFRETFSESKIYFNHFIKIHDPRVVNRKYLWMLIARGAAILCANNQVGIDILLPFTYQDDKLGRRNVSAVLIQVQNDRTTPRRWLFDGMNPYFVGIFDHSDEEPLPVIRMVFALSSTKSGVTIVEPEGTRYRKKAKGKKSPQYTSYDIWCAGAFAKTFAVIKETEEKTYEELLKVCNTFPELYKSPLDLDAVETLRRYMNPGAMADMDHWHGFQLAASRKDKDEETDDYDYDVESEQDDDIEMS